MKMLWTLLVLIALAWGGWRWFGGSASLAANGSHASERFVAKRGDLKIAIVENGYLKAKNSLNLSPEFEGEARIAWLVDEGKEVAEGDVLAEFDKSEIETQVHESERQLLQAQNEHEGSKAELEIERRDSMASIEAAEFNLKGAGMKLERYDKGEAPNLRRKMALEVEKADHDFARATERYQQVPDLEKEGFMTKIQAEQERIRLKEAEIGMENAHRELELFETYNDPMEHEQLAVNLKDAERQLVNAREKAEISVREKETRVSRSESELSQNEQRVTKLKEELSKMTIKAPRPGLVHYGDPGRPWERDQIKVGERLWRGNTLFTLPDLREMQVLIQVHEADIDLVRLEQPVHVTIEAFKDRVFVGKVTRINSVADSNWMDENNKTFGCEISMEAVDVKLRAGISAKVEIQVEELKDVVHVPIHAVVSEDGASFVFVPEGPAWRKQKVEIGKNNTHYVVVTDGLAAGDAVLLYDPRDTEVGADGGSGTDGARESTEATGAAVKS